MPPQEAMQACHLADYHTTTKRKRRTQNLPKIKQIGMNSN